MPASPDRERHNAKVRQLDTVYRILGRWSDRGQLPRVHCTFAHAQACRVSRSCRHFVATSFCRHQSSRNVAAIRSRMPERFVRRLAWQSGTTTNLSPGPWQGAGWAVCYLIALYELDVAESDRCRHEEHPTRNSSPVHAIVPCSHPVSPLCTDR